MSCFPPVLAEYDMCSSFLLPQHPQSIVKAAQNIDEDAVEFPEELIEVLGIRNLPLAFLWNGAQLRD